MGRRGLAGLFFMYKSHGAKGQGIESRSFLFIFVNVPRANSSEEMRVGRNRWSILARRKAGAATKRKDRQGFQEWIREVVRFVTEDD